MKRFTAISILVLAVGVGSLQAQQVATYNQQVSCILYTHCTTCHHDGGIAPFSLMTYSDAASAAFGILGSVSSGSMPPWPPNTEYNHLAHERVLTDNEIAIIENWVNNGAPEGTGTPPQAPVYLNEEEMTSPDLVLTMPSYTINSVVNDVYRCFVLDPQLSQDVFITKMEVVPGNLEAVHHALIYQDNSGTPETLDQNDPLPGYSSFGGTGSSASKLIGAWTPGQGMTVYPNGMGVKLPAGAKVVMQVHYPTSANGQSDQTKINLQYTTSGAIREVSISSPLNYFDLNEGPLVIPANQVSTFTANYSIPQQVSLTVLNVFPHMHLLGKSISVWAETPSNQTIPMVEIEDWDFHWQGFYDFRNPIKLPGGTVLRSSATYDNTSSNPYNPNDPPVTVTGGESTTEEMMLVYFSYTLYFNGDENIVIDGSTHQDDVCEPFAIGVDEQFTDHVSFYPNPTTGIVFINSSGKWSNIDVTDVSGKSVYASSGLISSIDLSQLANGVYQLTLRTDDGSVSGKLILDR